MDDKLLFYAIGVLTTSVITGVGVIASKRLPRVGDGMARTVTGLAVGLSVLVVWWLHSRSVPLRADKLRLLVPYAGITAWALIIGNIWFTVRGVQASVADADSRVAAAAEAAISRIEKRLRDDYPTNGAVSGALQAQESQLMRLMGDPSALAAMVKRRKEEAQWRRDEANRIDSKWWVREWVKLSAAVALANGVDPEKIPRDQRGEPIAEFTREFDEALSCLERGSLAGDLADQSVEPAQFAKWAIARWGRRPTMPAQFMALADSISP